MHVMKAPGHDQLSRNCANVLNTSSGSRCACAAAHMGCGLDSHEVTQHSFHMYMGKAPVTWGGAHPAQSICARANRD